MCVYSNVRTLAVVEYMHRGRNVGEENTETQSTKLSQIFSSLSLIRDNYDYCIVMRLCRGVQRHSRLSYEQPTHTILTMGIAMEAGAELCSRWESSMIFCFSESDNGECTTSRRCDRSDSFSSDSRCTSCA